MSVDFAPAAAGSRRLARAAKRLGLSTAALALLGTAALAQTQEAPAQQPAVQQTQTSEPQTAPASTAAPTTGRSAPTATAPAAPAPSTNAAAAPQAPAPLNQGTTTAAPAANGSSAAQVPSTVSPSITPEPTATNQGSPSVVPAPQESVTELAPAEEPKPLTIPHDLSPWGMFLAADWVVKSVMIGLAFASLATWTVWLVKTLELTCARARAGRTIKIIRTSRTLAEALDATASRGGPAAYMLRAAAEEVQLSAAALDHVEGDGVKERVGSSLSRIEAFAGRRIARGTGILATIGSTGPFVGLFGTVWGIMNAFIGISETQTTNLAVVAPGIAEALMATAIGLVAAIPAVVIYNVFARSVTGYRQLLADAAAGVERLVSRDLDFRKVPPGGRKPTSMSLVAGE